MTRSQEGDDRDEALPGLRIGEVVLRTARFNEMRAWYRSMLAVEPFYEHVPLERAATEGPAVEHWASERRLCFFRLTLDHPYQQVIGIFDVPEAQRPAGVGHAGLHHFQLGDASPEVLTLRHARLKRLGIAPFRAVDHGPSTSLYYRDPDANVVEIAAPNHVRVEDFLDALRSPTFQKNPSGLPVDPETMG
jgi:catechol-2,3-dioxygenase